MTTQTGRSGGRRSIRYPILAIAWIPSLVLLVIGLVVAGSLAYQGAEMRRYNDQFNGTSRSAAAFMTGVFTERRLSEAAVVDPAANMGELAATRGRVDKAAPAFLGDVRILAVSYPSAYRSMAAYLEQLPPRLASMRDRVSTGQASLVEVSEFYSDITGHVADNLFASTATQPLPTAASEAALGVTLLRATDELLDADALAVAAFAGEGGLSDEEFALFVRREGAARARFAEVVPLLQPDERAALTALQRSAAWKQLEQAHRAALLTRGRAVPDAADQRSGARNGERVTNAAGATREAGRGTRPVPPIDPQTWGRNVGKVVEGVTGINLRHSAYAASLSTRAGDAQLQRSLLIGAGLLLLAVLVFLATTLASSRIVNRLRRLRSETLLLSQDRLPAIVDRLRDGTSVDVSAELPPLRFGSDEIGQVAQAFEEAQRTAVEAAAREAETRAGLRTVFLDIAHRSQAIVHRQLKVLDQAERAQEDPDQLALLFQLDHLSTRARRNAENLIILGGGQAGRQWRNPVPLIEITRSAISEAEDYVRVQIAGLPRVTIHGAAVADVIHLLAELVDNATNFSPPMSRVEVRGNLVGRGVVLEIEDQGLGIDPEQIEQLNRMLHEPPDFQVMALADEPRLGLFVVGQLASRHGIRVTITPSPAYGGTRVVVLLPSSLIAGDPALDVPRRDHLGLGGPAPDDAPLPPSGPFPRPLGLASGNGSLPPAQANGANGSNGANGAKGVRRLEGPPPSLDAVMTAPELFATGPASVAGPVPGAPGEPVDDVVLAFPQQPDRKDVPRPPVPGVFPAPLQDVGLFEPHNGLATDPSVPSATSATTPTAPIASPGSVGSADDAPGVIDLRPFDAPATPATPATPVGTEPGHGAGSPTRPELPRRSRQAHLSPLLRDLPADSADPADPAAAPDLPDAELARDRMAALQRGTLRGRATDPEA